MKFEELTSEKLTGVGHAFVFICPDDLLVDESRRIFAHAFGGEWAFERLSVKEFESIDGADLVEAALSPPLFGPGRALVVSEAGKVTRKRMDIIGEIASMADSSLKIILLASSRRDTPKKAPSLRVIEVDPIRTRDASRWLRRTYNVTPEVAQYLVETLGSELRPLSQEIEKLTTYVRGGRPVELRDIDMLTLRSEQFSPFQLDDALIERDYPKAVRVADGMAEEGIEPLVILARIARVWRQLLIGKALASTCSQKELAARASIPHWKASTFRAACERIPWSVLFDGFQGLLAADEKFKSTPTDRALVLDLLLWRLLRFQP